LQSARSRSRLTDGEEAGRPGGTGTDPLNPDTDSDGHSDGDEVTNGWDPLDPNDPGTPVDIPAMSAALRALLLALLLGPGFSSLRGPRFPRRT
jgi:hypothetical protein